MSKVLAALLGIAGGFAAGILLAPKSGKETREIIMNKAGEVKDKAQDGLEEVKKGASSIRQEVTKTAGNVRKAAQ